MCFSIFNLCVKCLSRFVHVRVCKRVQISKLDVSITLHLISETGLPGTWSLWVQLNWLITSSRYSSVSAFPVHTLLDLMFFRWILGDPNSSLHACKASTLLSESSPRPLL